MIHYSPDRATHVRRANGIRFAYRDSARPAVCLSSQPALHRHHGLWDPTVTDGLARDRNDPVQQRASPQLRRGPDDVRADGR